MAPSLDARVLVVDDEPSLREVLQVALSRQGMSVVLAPGARAAMEALASAPTPFPLVITDLSMPDGSGQEVLRAAKTRSAATEVIMVTAHSSLDAALDAMRDGAYDFVAKPFSTGELVALAQKALEKSRLSQENQRLRAHLARLEIPPEQTDASPAMRPVLELIGKIAKTKTTVLITGESGTGKERIARMIHQRSDRSSGPFAVINCGALPEALMESELFGHERGAFTGAVAASPGLFRQATGGTLFLDEIGELPVSLQVKLLRALQERKIRPVGGAQELDVDVRVLAATNRDVEKDVADGRFRQDLYYRLNVIRVALPPLRERAGEVRRLAREFLTQLAAEMGKDVREFSPDALAALERYPFPGNVRELQNIVERALALASASVIGLGDLPSPISEAPLGKATLGAGLPPGGCSLDLVLDDLERRLVIEALERTGGLQKPAAEILQITPRSLRYRLKKHGLGGGEDDSDADEPAAEKRRAPTLR